MTSRNYVLFDQFGNIMPGPAYVEGGTGDVAAHTGDTTDAHDASAISFVPAGTIAAGNVQAAIEEVATEAGPGGLNIVVDNPTAGIACDIEMPFAGTWLSWRVFNDAAGSIVYDLWKDTYANFPPTVADTITASAKPTTSSAAKAQNTTLTGWTTAFSAGDVVRVNIDSTSGLVRSVLSLRYARA